MGLIDFRIASMAMPMLLHQLQPISHKFCLSLLHPQFWYQCWEKRPHQFVVERQDIEGLPVAFPNSIYRDLPTNQTLKMS